ncbi:MAG: 2-hydroxychromene-2-carboxylate isomerase [Hyphomicrobiaceae bacterium]|nr:2-hydroxychromene-2-carboxylate isomerase [Hyphomicrobiaceae bacterium]
MPRLEYWYEFASTYSYVSTMRIGALAGAAGVEIVWRPFLLGPIFAAQGWTNSPFNLYPAKGRYMWRDMERLCADERLPLKRPAKFPQNTLLAARTALTLAQPERAAFSRAAFHAEFADGADLADPAVVNALIGGLGLDIPMVTARAGSPDIKAALKTQTDQAATLGIFGSPSFVAADGELFWGNDRLEQALQWARRG